MEMPSINFSYWFLQTLAMVLTAILIPGLKITGPLGALGMVVALAFVNAHLWDAALFFRIPDSLTSQALSLVVANGLIFWTLVKILPGIEIRGIVAALIAPIIFTFSSLLIAEYGSEIDWLKVLDTIVAFIRDQRDHFRGVVPHEKMVSS